MADDLKGTVYDAIQSVLGGANSGVDTDLVAINQFCWGKNISIRGGKLAQRPPIAKRYQLPTGKVQGATYFSINGGSIVCSIDGKIYKIYINRNTYSTVDITPTDNRNSRSMPIAYMCETPGYLVIQDNQSRAIIHDGYNSRRAGEDEVPVGGPTVYGNGRMWVMTGSQVLAGDIYQGGNTHLSFTETTYLSEGGSFSLPENGTGMAFLPRIDNTTATGDLICFTNTTTTAIQATIFDRTQWKSTQGMQRLLFPSIGCSSHKSIASVNQDLYFISQDGVRSIRNTYASLNDVGNVPISQEISRLVDYNTDAWLKYCPGVYYNNRYLAGMNPRIIRHDSDIDGAIGINHVCNSVVSLDFASICSLGKTNGMAYDGEWDNLNVIEFVRGTFSGENRLFAICGNDDGEIWLYEILNKGSFDIEDGTRNRIQSSVELRRTNFQAPYSWKNLWSIEIWWQNIVGPVDFKVYLRPDSSQKWFQWELIEDELCSQFEKCSLDTASCETPQNFIPGYYAKYITKAPPEEDISVWTDGQVSVGTDFQARIDWVGSAKIGKILVTANVRNTNPRGERVDYGV